MSDLVEFLRARLDERAAKAQAAMHGGEGRWQQRDPDRRPGLIVDERDEVVTYDEGSPTPEQTAHIETNDPARVLREVETKRQLISEILAECEGAGYDHNRGIYGKVLRSLAQPYREE